jgi:uncharacterized phage-associated protein|tara:strand:- start:2392 stop:2868 length:477 start_codon:yes stop_codon:yes gene_type:complete
MPTIQQIADYVILRLKDNGNNYYLSTLAHQKLIYYCQAWHLALKKKPLFEDNFQAWVHGPVNRWVYANYNSDKTIYSDLKMNDIIDRSGIDRLSQEEISHVNLVLDSYAKFSASQLEEMTHNEEPWIEARGNFTPLQRCTNPIDNKTMENYYAARLNG